MLKFLVKVFISLYLLNMWIDKVDTLHVGRYCSEVYSVPSWPTLVDLDVKVTYRYFVLKFLVKVYINQYLLNMLMDIVDTLHIDRYWYQVLCCTITTHLDDLEVKVMDFEILYSGFC